MQDGKDSDLARDGTQDYRLTATENNSTTKITNAIEKNIHKMMNANQVPLRTSLTDWYDTSYSYLLVLAWDELMVPLLLVVTIRCSHILLHLHMVMDSMETL